MTVCVAAWSAYEEIVTASDTKLSWGAYSAERAALKTSTLWADWDVLYAGRDVTVVPALLRRCEEKLRGRVGQWNDPASVGDMTAALWEGFRDERRFRAEENVLEPYGLDWDTFNRRGIRVFGAVDAGVIRAQLAQYKLPCQLLVCGFSGKRGALNRMGHVLTVGGDDDQWMVRDHDASGFCAIGSGCFMASATLAMRGQSPRTSPEHTLYNVCEAKFIAETADGIGDETVVSVMRSDGRSEILDADTIGQIRRAWERQGQPKRPKAAMTSIQQWRRAAGWDKGSPD